MDRTSLSVSDLLDVFATDRCPILVDVRRDPAFLGDDRMIAGALRGAPEDVDRWARLLPAGAAVVVHCVHGHEVSQGAAKVLREQGIAAAFLEGGITAWREAGGATRRRPESPRRVGDAPSRWVTRARPKSDAVACHWLVRRFLDRDAEILLMPADDVPGMARETGALPFDMPGAAHGNAGEGCGFGAVLHRYDIEDGVLPHMARIVRGADAARMNLEPEPAGLLAIASGLSALMPGNARMLEHGMILYDALYAWTRNCRDESHSRPLRA